MLGCLRKIRFSSSVSFPILIFSEVTNTRKLTKETSRFASSIAATMSHALNSLCIRRAEVEDGREFNILINSLGGQALFRALFGQYNFTSLVEYAHLSLVAMNEEDSCVCFAAFSDGSAGTSENIPFDELILQLSSTIPCRVR